MQTKRDSVIESLANTTVGIVISLVSQAAIMKFFGVEITLVENIGITTWFTLISIIRSYTIRRVFNRLGEKR